MWKWPGNNQMPKTLNRPSPRIANPQSHTVVEHIKTGAQEIRTTRIIYPVFFLWAVTTTDAKKNVIAPLIHNKLVIVLRLLITTVTRVDVQHCVGGIVLFLVFHVMDNCWRFYWERTSWFRHNLRFSGFGYGISGILGWRISDFLDTFLSPDWGTWRRVH